ncbi:MAG: hypothetical protein MRQ13_03625 [Candidatus Midichloria sp.]|nr:hypothetical protein [Candidatus Midichloria sp.]
MRYFEGEVHELSRILVGKEGMREVTIKIGNIFSKAKGVIPDTAIGIATRFLNISISISMIGRIGVKFIS